MKLYQNLLKNVHYYYGVINIIDMKKLFQIMNYQNIYIKIFIIYTMID